MTQHPKINVAGHRGMVGSAIVRQLLTQGHPAERIVVSTQRIPVQVFLLSENQSTYIPIGAVHRLHNPGKLVLEMIEMQSGSYLGEDDIVRLEDTYGRVPK